MLKSLDLLWMCYPCRDNYDSFFFYTKIAKNYITLYQPYQKKNTNSMQKCIEIYPKFPRHTRHTQNTKRRWGRPAAAWYFGYISYILYILGSFEYLFVHYVLCIVTLFFGICNVYCLHAFLWVGTSCRDFLERRLIHICSPCPSSTKAITRMQPADCNWRVGV